MKGLNMNRTRLTASVTERLDRVATELEQAGRPDMALALDQISDRLDKMAEQGRVSNQYYVEESELIDGLLLKKRLDPSFQEGVIKELKKKLERPENSDLFKSLCDQLHTQLGTSVNYSIDGLVSKIRENYNLRKDGYLPWIRTRGEPSNFLYTLDKDAIEDYESELRKKYPPGWYNEDTKSLIIKEEDVPMASSASDDYRSESKIAWGENNKPYVVHYYHNGGVASIEDATKEDLETRTAKTKRDG